MSSTYNYLTRIIPALSVLALVALLFVALVVAPYGKFGRGEHHGRSTNSQLFLALYTVLLHIPSVLFPARVCWAIGDVMKRMKESANFRDDPKGRKTVNVKKGQETIAYPSPLFVIIVPAYKEAVETLEETLRVLASHSQARHAYHIYLAMEGKEEGSDVKATQLIRSFERSFYKMSFTIHPSGIPGEAQGKSSNESWAAKQAFADYPANIKKDVIMTVMDADTHLSSRYFTQVARYHADYPSTNSETLYVPPLVFDRNVHNVPLPVRTSDLVWAGAGISNLYTGSKICIPTSVYSLPMVLAEGVGGWDTGPEAIGEDMHMYLKCFFALSGHLTVRVVYSAASQCNVSSDLQGVAGYYDGLAARYGQALRHMWGSMDTGYAVRQAVAMIQRHSQASCGGKSSFRNLAVYWKDAFLSAISTFCGSNWTALHQNKTSPKPPQTTTPFPRRKIHIRNTLLLFNSLFEAHFLPVHLALILTITTIYDMIAGSLIPSELQLALRFSGTCRFIGWSLICVYFYRYGKYHRLCLELREAEMREAGLLQGDHEERNGFSRRLFGPLGCLEAALFPIGGFLFGSIPACQAVLSHVFTDRLTYHVSLKPQFIRRVMKEDLPPPTPTQSKPSRPSRTRPPHQKVSHHVRYPSDTWRRQAMVHFEHFSSTWALNRPVKQKD